METNIKATNTLQGLVNNLNSSYFPAGEFSLDSNKTVNSRKIKCNGKTVAMFTVIDNGGFWHFMFKSTDMFKDKFLVSNILTDIADFAANSDSRDWLKEPEKKYNIIISSSKEKGKEYHLAYRKLFKGLFHPDDTSDEILAHVSVFPVEDYSKLEQPEYLFAESEVEQIKAQLERQVSPKGSEGVKEVFSTNTIDKQKVLAPELVQETQI